MADPRVSTARSLVPGRPLLLFGAGGFGKRVAAALSALGYSIVAFVDACPRAVAVMGIPVYSWEMVVALGLLEESLVICTIFNRSCAYQDLLATANAHGCSDLLMPWDYYPLIARDIGWQYWLSEVPFDAQKNDISAARFSTLFGLLADEESRSILERTFAFRAGKDLGFSRYRSSGPQYFNACSLSPGRQADGITYLDVGAYEGESLIDLSKSIRLDRAILIEPSLANFENLCGRMKDWLVSNSGVELTLLPMALGDRRDVVVLRGEGEAASVQHECAVRESSGSKTTLLAKADDLFPSLCVDFVKIDAEGSDLACIRGMAQLLRRSRPVVAVSVYHRPGDMLEIPLAIHGLLGGHYDYFLRQHHYNSFDCVFYAVPRCKLDSVA